MRLPRVIRVQQEVVGPRKQQRWRPRAPDSHSFVSCLVKSRGICSRLLPPCRWLPFIVLGIASMGCMLLAVGHDSSLNIMNQAIDRTVILIRESTQRGMTR